MPGIGLFRKIALVIGPGKIKILMVGIFTLKNVPVFDIYELTNLFADIATLRDRL